MLALSAITLAGLLIRLVEIDRWPLWGDEALTVMIAQWPAQYLFLAAVDPTPGLYYLLHKLFLGPMIDAAAARSISLVCGTLLIPVVYVLAREARVPALLSAGLVALSFPLIDYSQEARAYSLLVLLVALSATFFIRWSSSRRPLDLFGMLATCLLAFYTHFASVFWIGPAVLAVGWLGRRRVVAPLVLTALLAVPELLRITRYPSEGFVWLAQATPAEAAETLAKLLLPFRPGAGWLLLAMFIIAWRAWVHRRPLLAWARANSGATAAIAILAAAPLLLWLFGLAGRPVFMTRTILIGVPGALLALALLLKFEHRIVRFMVVALYGASLLVNGTTRQKEPWDLAAERVGGDAILMCEPGQVAAMRHVTTGNNLMLLRRFDGVAEIGGNPWPRAYFATMSNRRRMAEALERGKSISPTFYPVWPVNAGRIAGGRRAPVTLGQAIRICEMDDMGRGPRYYVE